MRKTSRELAGRLEFRHHVLRLSPYRVHTREFWTQLADFKPEIIHYIGGPSSFTILLLHLMKTVAGAKSVVSALHPQYLYFHGLLQVLAPDLLLVQSTRSVRILSSYAPRIEWLGGGVDTGKFKPADPAEKLQLRLKYGIPQSSYVVLHVGNARRARNLGSLAKLAESSGSLFIVVVSSSLSIHKTSLNALERAGCIIVDQFVAEIEEYYRLSDCFVFTVNSPSGAIDLPLSVLEAMSCDLPVVTTRFGGLPDNFTETPTLRFADHTSDTIESLISIRDLPSGQGNRDQVLIHDWDTVIEQLETQYASL